ncbi:putative uncharacterized protein [Prevotella sp. CAG:604]|nr:putative uncharacterized protein [Prevotella sp. CAG:604]
MNIKKHIPNTITCCNLVSGCIATSYAFGGAPKMALLWIIIGAVFDFFDGMSARLLHVSSPIGKELDSLADDVTFGVAPSTIVFSQLFVMNYPSFLEPLREYLPYAAFIIAAFSALRLAKFNLDERQTTSFIGVPTPANALFWGSLIVFDPFWLSGYTWSIWVVLALILVTSYLLVCEMPLFALKFKQWTYKGNEIKWWFAAFSLAVIVVSIIEDGLMGFLEGWWIVIVAYVLTSVIKYLVENKKGTSLKRKEKADTTTWLHIDIKYFKRRINK